MVMNKHYILSMMAAAVLLAGCSDIAEEQEIRTPIRLITSIAPTRATTTQDVQIADGQNLYVWATAEASPYLTAWRLTADGAGGFSSQSSTPYYPNSSLAMTYIHGNIQPAIVDEKTELPATMSHTVKIDQRQAADYASSDLLYLNEASVSAQNTHAITLQHKLSKIAIVLTSSEYSNDLLAKADVRICGIKPQIAITTADGTLADATQGTQAATIRPYQSSASTPEFEAIIPCKQVKPDKLITISLNGQTAQLNPTAPADAAQFESGKKYTYTITVSQTAITFANSTITNWTDYSGSTPISNVDSHNTIDIRRNPLWYVSKSNLNQDGTSFSISQTSTQGYLYKWATAMALGYTASTDTYNGYALPSTPKAATNDLVGATWHIPTAMEWESITPSGNHDLILNSAAGLITEPACTFGYNNDTKFGAGNTSNPATPTGTQYKSYWSTYEASSDTHYAIRFLGTPYCSVWRYKLFDMGSKNTTARLEISSRLIDQINEDETARLEAMMTTITAADYDWTENENAGAVQRLFYACGHSTSTEEVPSASTTYIGENGYYWSTTNNPTIATKAYRMYFRSGAIGIYYDNDKTQAKSVRLFRDGYDYADPKTTIADATTSNISVGDILCSDGSIYDAANARYVINVKTPIGVIVHVGATGNSTYNRALVMAMKDANKGNTCAWKTANGTLDNSVQYTNSSNFTSEDGSIYISSRNNSTWPAFQAAISNNGILAPSGTSGWFLPSAYQWNLMVNSMGSYTALRDCFASRGGTNILGASENGWYWSVSEYNANFAWYFTLHNGAWNCSSSNKTNNAAQHVRSCLAF